MTWNTPGFRAFLAALSVSGLFPESALAVQDYTPYVNVVQNANGMYGLHRSALLRFPFGRAGIWTMDKGEVADSVGRGLLLYPCVDAIVPRGRSEWRESVSGEPSQVRITYRTNVAAQGSSVDLTVTPHVSCYRYRFAEGTNFHAVTLATLEDGGLFSWDKNAPRKWTNNVFTIVDDRTVELTVSGAKRIPVYYCIKFSSGCIGQGAMLETNVIEGADSVTGDRIGVFLKFKAPEVVTAVAVSHTSMAQAREYLKREFAAMDFAAAARKLKEAWISRLARVEARGPELRMRQLYTALYTIYANVIDATDNPHYRCKSPLLTIASSDFWQYIGGYMRCDWDMSRGVYSLLALVDPELLGNVINSYQVQYDRDGKFLPNWDPFWASGFRESLYLANFATLARQTGIQGVDYVRLKDSLANHVEQNYQKPFFTLGYVPAESSDASPASRTLEYCTQLQGLAILARTLGDTATFDRYFHCRTNYATLYDPANEQFRVRSATGEWGPLGRAKFFEGSGVDYGFCAPHDPYGLLNLYGPSNAVSKIREYMKRKSDFNDYQLIYEFLPLFADRADVTAEIVRTSHIPKFDTVIMSEGLWPGSMGCYYTDNAGPLACCLLGLYWIPTSGGTWLLTAPSFDRVVIHGRTDLTIETAFSAPGDNFINAIKLNGEAYPSYQISAATLSARNQRLTFTLGAQPSRLGKIYLSSADGEVLSATTDNRARLDFEIEPLAASCSAQVYCATSPVAIARNGMQFSDWSYDSVSHLATLRNVTKGHYRIIATTDDGH